MKKEKPVLAIDFDGTLRVDENTPTPGALEAVREYLKHFEVNVYAARSAQPGGPKEMRAWCKKHGFPVSEMKFPRGKPAIHALIDDQAFRFEGEWPEVYQLKIERSWNDPASIFPCNVCGGHGEYGVGADKEETWVKCGYCNGAGRMTRDQRIAQLALYAKTTAEREAKKKVTT